jgi:hypothetical protein
MWRQKPQRRPPTYEAPPRRKQMAANKAEPAEDLAGRIDELEQEGHALRAKITRLQHAGTTVIGQREHWKSQALAAEEVDDIPPCACSTSLTLAAARSPAIMQTNRLPLSVIER